MNLSTRSVAIVNSELPEKVVLLSRAQSVLRRSVKRPKLTKSDRLLSP